MLALDAECIYLIKLLLCCSVVGLTPLSRPLVSSPPFFNMRVRLPKNGSKERDAKNSLNGEVCQEKGKGYKKVGEEKFAMQNIALLKQE